MGEVIAKRRPGVNRRRQRRTAWLRAVILTVVGSFFLLPLYAMGEFTLCPSGSRSGLSFDAWREIVQYPDLVSGVEISLELVVLTSATTLALLVPSMIWIRLRLPRLQRTVEFLCLLPLAIPAIVLVVGLAPVYLWVTYFFGDSALTLTFAYVILALPYTFRTLDAGLAALDVKTLSEAARSLGSRWPTVILRVIVPNLSSALMNATLLAVALVVGEFTVANLLNFQNLQTEIYTLGRVNAPVSVAVALGSLLFSFVLLLAITFLGSLSRGRQNRGVLT